MKWKNVPFGSLYQQPSRNGLSKPSRVRGSGVKMVNMGELFAHDRIFDIPMELVPVTEKELSTSSLEQEDLLFARQSLVLEGAGKCSIVKEITEPTVFESHLIRVRLDSAKALPEFYYYYFKSPLSSIKSIVSQCAQAGIKATDLAALSVACPPLPVQKKIAESLALYDSLIENNRKQIKLLEEAAQRLYKEWFVDLRFPGHEHTPIIDGIPQGWHRGHVSDIGTFTRGKTITKEQTRQGSIPVVAGGLAPAYYHDQANTRPPVVTISASGANAGYVSLYQVPVWASDCSYVDAGNTKNLYLMYAVCTYAQAAINHLRKGAAQPHVYASAVNELEILVGDSSIQRMYEAQVCPLFEKRALLSQQMTLLTEARDRLLPKLMSGEVEV